MEVWPSLFACPPPAGRRIRGYSNATRTIAQITAMMISTERLTECNPASGSTTLDIATNCHSKVRSSDRTSGGATGDDSFSPLSRQDT